MWSVKFTMQIWQQLVFQATSQPPLCLIFISWIWCRRLDMAQHIPMLPSFCRLSLPSRMGRVVLKDQG